MYSAKLYMLEDKQILKHSLDLGLNLRFSDSEADIPFSDLLVHILKITVKSRFLF